MAERLAKPVIWLADSLRVLKTFSSTVQDEIGYALYLAQRGERHVSSKPLKGLGSGVFVLHAFQKKSKHGIATPQSEIDLIKRRLKLAMAISDAQE